MPPDRIDPRQLSSRTLTIAGSIGLALLVVSFFIDVRIVVLTPNYGDVTRLVRTAWQLSIGLATLGSFLLAIHNSTTENASSRGPARQFEIKGENHDIDVHIHGFEPDEVAEPDDRHENDTSTPDERVSEEDE